MSDFDSPWKEALDHYFPAFLDFFFPNIHADIDWSRDYEMLDKELQQVVRTAELAYVAHNVDKGQRKSSFFPTKRRFFVVETRNVLPSADLCPNLPRLTQDVVIFARKNTRNGQLRNIG